MPIDAGGWRGKKGGGQPVMALGMVLAPVMVPAPGQGDRETPLVGDGRRVRGIDAGHGWGERLDAGTAWVVLPVWRSGGPGGHPLALESSSGVREKEGTNSRMNSWTSGSGFWLMAS